MKELALRYKTSLYIIMIAISRETQTLIYVIEMYLSVILNYAIILSATVSMGRTCLILFFKAL